MADVIFSLNERFFMAIRVISDGATNFAINSLHIAFLQNGEQHENTKTNRRETQRTLR